MCQRSHCAVFYVFLFPHLTDQICKYQEVKNFTQVARTPDKTYTDIYNSIDMAGQLDSNL